ncbi:Dephospho-CoA kinase CoaE [Helicobacter bizzozeronii]|uniref:dephospho-CoA kinase n=1 Tax=Helicobacter bizzozeronii TaxID=56877 RepID=UPI00244D82FA|nr:dephospho-CoA kinase [Helicobacter bizzozeronii]GMB93513.1 Dephospho-CoA kinase CoaE [Helicobacter bizzozeronii]
MSLAYAFVLTGGIGTGKSTAANLLRLHGYQVLDADKIAHQLLDQHALEIQALFAEDILNAGKIDRPKLGEIVFANASKRHQLEGFIHPKVRQELLEQAQSLETHHQPYFLDIPLYYEVQGVKSYGITQVVLVYAPREVQIQRVAQRDHLSPHQIAQRLNAQMDIEIKKSLSPLVLDNSKDLKHLQQEIEGLILDLPKMCQP